MTDRSDRSAPASSSVVRPFGWRFMLLVVFALAILFNPVADPDLFGHVLYGEWILGGVNGSGTFRIPDRGHFSFTASDRPWIDHEWLFHAGFAGLHRALGDRGPLVYQLAMVAGIITFVLLAMRRPGRSTAGLMVGMVLPVLALKPGVTARPQLITYLGVAALFWLFTRSDRGSPYWWLFVPGFLLWANLHGGFVAGLVLAASWLPVVALDRSYREAGRCLGWLTAGGLITLLNPYGFELWAYLVRELTNPLASVLISEWKPLWERPYHLTVAVLLCGQAVLVLWRKEGGGIKQWLTAFPLLICLAATVRSGRNLPLLAIAAGTAGTVPLPLRRVLRNRLGRIIMGFAVLLGLHLGYRFADGLQVPEEKFPRSLARPLMEADTSHRVYAHLDWAQWLLFHNPRLEMFLDGRFSTLYSERIINEYARTMLGDLRYLEAHGVQWVLIPPWYPLNHELKENPAWTLSRTTPHGRLWKHTLLRGR